MKKAFTQGGRRTGVAVVVLLVALVALAALSGCGVKTAAEDDAAGGTDQSKVIKVGASPTPHAQILEQVADDLAAEGWKLEVVEYTDYVLPNTDLQAGEIDANYFQHAPYLKDFNEENGTELVSVGGIHFEPLGLYAGKTASLAQLAEGGKIAVPNDTTNEARALLLLEKEGLIKLKEGAGLEATIKDIAENPKDLKFVEVEAAAAPATLPEVDFAVINGNYALSAGLSVDDVVASESADSLAAQTFANIVVVKAGNEDTPGVKALVKALTSEKVRTYIQDEFGGAVVPVF